MTRESTLKAPMNDLIWVTVSGGGHEARVAMRCGLALHVPEFQTQPSIVVDWGLMIVLGAERRRSHLCRACSTFFQFERSSPGELPPQYRSSAILVTIPSFNRSPSTLLMSSSRAVSEPGIPMADRACTRTPRYETGLFACSQLKTFARFSFRQN